MPKRFRHVVIERSCGGRVTSPCGKSGDLENTNATIQSDREHVIDLEGVSRRFLRVPLTRTWPASTSAAAWVRALTTRACHNHLSRRCRSKDTYKSHQTGHHDSDPTAGQLIVRRPASILAAGKLLLERGQFRKRRIRIDRTLTLARRRAAGVGAVRRSGIRPSLTAALAGALKPTLVLIPVSALALEALARRTSFALAQFTAGWSLARGRQAFGWRIGGGLTDLLLTLAPSPPMPLALLRPLTRFSVRGRRLRAILPGCCRR